MMLLSYSRMLATLAFVVTMHAAEPTLFTTSVCGDGPDVILIPGFAPPASVWDATVSQLKATHRVHAVQVAGFAGAPVSGKPSEILAPLVGELAAYIKAKNLHAPAIIGHSMGGEAALMLAARHPEAVGRTMVVDALPFFPLLMNPSATAEGMRTAASAMRDRIMAQSHAEFAQEQRMTMNRLVKTAAARNLLATETAKSDPVVTAHAMYEVMTTDLRPELAAIHAPLTVIYAYDSAYGVPATAIDELFAQTYANAKTVTLKRVDGSFHFIMLDQPARFADYVDAFLK